MRSNSSLLFSSKIMDVEEKRTNFRAPKLKNLSCTLLSLLFIDVLTRVESTFSGIKQINFIFFYPISTFFPPYLLKMIPDRPLGGLWSDNMRNVRVKRDEHWNIVPIRRDHLSVKEGWLYGLVTILFLVLGKSFGRYQEPHTLFPTARGWLFWVFHTFTQWDRKKDWW